MLTAETKKNTFHKTVMKRKRSIQQTFYFTHPHHKYVIVKRKIVRYFHDSRVTSEVATRATGTNGALHTAGEAQQDVLGSTKRLLAIQ